jgi:hypothetical protein
MVNGILNKISRKIIVFNQNLPVCAAVSILTHLYFSML